MFPKEKDGQPIIYRLSRDFDVVFNILKAKVTADEDGVLLMELSGPRRRVQSAVRFLEDQGVEVTTLLKGVVLDPEKCTHCGACVVVCPSGALSLEADTMKVLFDNEKCIACEFCVRACPPRAMEVHF